MTLTHRIIEPGVHLYEGQQSYTVMRLYPHLPWTVRNQDGWVLEKCNSLRECERRIKEREDNII